MQLSDNLPAGQLVLTVAPAVSDVPGTVATAAEAVV
jgi:D-alanyl-D-alanine carboxypeptidase